MFNMPNGTIEELAEVKNYYPIPTTSILASVAGLVPDSAASKVANANAFKTAINDYGKIIIDGVYYIGNSSVTNYARDIDIEGQTGSQLICDFTSTEVWFNPNELDSFRIQDVDIDNIGSTLLIGYDDETNHRLVESVYVDGCTFNGVISLFRLYGDLTLNSDFVDFGVKYLTLTNNTITNTTTSFVVLNDVPFKKVDVSNNIITNWRLSFINLTLTNESTYEEELRNNRVYAKFFNNTVTNEITWWSGTSTSYYCFVLAECYEVFYRKNHIEGMKSDVASKPLYDSYLSCVYLEYTDNVWKNNIVFNATDPYGVLIKSKQSGLGGTIGDAESIYRNYVGNTYTVEESYATACSMSPTLLKVDFLDNVSLGEKYTIKNNTFNVYEIDFLARQRVKDFVVENNTFNLEYALGYMFYGEVDDDFEPTFSITDNNITVANASAALSLVRIYDSTTGANRCASMTIEDNIIDAPLTYLVQDSCCDTPDLVIPTGNTITVYTAEWVQALFGDNPVVTVDGITVV